MEVAMIDEIYDGKVVLNTVILKQLRRQYGLSQERFYQQCIDKKVRISLATIKRAETGKKVNYRTAHELARFYELNLNDILLVQLKMSVAL